MPDYFLDTSVLIAYFNREDTRTVELIETVRRGEATAAISAMTVAELWAAAVMHDDEERARRIALVTLLDVTPIDFTLAQRGGELRRVHGLKIADALIAACAQHAGGKFMSKDPHYNRLLRASVLAGEVYA
jgi:predicted nucleic acid-binding protein